mmetsp:Transcript_40228/g.93145  ORF Transcript_40228/g.93145 Transcript_40228/m.93145 type:complete len:244 (-) Transcript_40228:2131-2862(-)
MGNEVVGHMQKVVLEAVVQRCVASQVLAIDIDAVLEKELGNAPVVVLACNVKHVVSKLVPRFEDAALLLDDGLDGFVPVVPHEGEGHVVVLLEVGEFVVFDKLALLVEFGRLRGYHQVWPCLPVGAHDQADVWVHHVPLVGHDGLLSGGGIWVHQEAHIAFATHLLLGESIHVHVGHVNLVVVTPLRSLRVRVLVKLVAAHLQRSGEHSLGAVRPRCRVGEVGELGRALGLTHGRTAVGSTSS